MHDINFRSQLSAYVVAAIWHKPWHNVTRTQIVQYKGNCMVVLQGVAVYNNCEAENSGNDENF